jgi:hypothetical protein
MCIPRSCDSWYNEPEAVAFRLPVFNHRGGSKEIWHWTLVLKRFVTYVLLVMSSIPVTFGESDLRLLENNGFQGLKIPPWCLERILRSGWCFGSISTSVSQRRLLISVLLAENLERGQDFARPAKLIALRRNVSLGSFVSVHFEYRRIRYKSWYSPAPPSIWEASVFWKTLCLAQHRRLHTFSPPSSRFPRYNNN